MTKPLFLSVFRQIIPLLLRKMGVLPCPTTERQPPMSSEAFRRRESWSLPVLALLALAAALLWLAPVDPVQAQDDSVPAGITAGRAIISIPESGDAYGRRQVVSVAFTLSQPVIVTGSRACVSPSAARSGGPNTTTPTRTAPSLSSPTSSSPKTWTTTASASERTSWI